MSWTEMRRLIVLNSIQIGSTAQKKNFDGPVIGAKMSAKNSRNFSNEKMKAGQNVIGLQVQI